MHELDLRISDADRDNAEQLLHRSVGDGRIDWAEHEERLASVYAARTGADLVQILADLSPLDGASGPPAAWSPQRQRPTPALQVMLSKVVRRPEPGNGPQRINVTLGAVVLDLRDLPRGCQLDVVANTTLGKVEVHVSPGTRLIDTGTAWLGKRSTVDRSHRPVPSQRLAADAPVVRLGGHSVLGHVRVTIH
jgi:hypothetical protein